MPISGSIDTITEHNLSHPVSSSVNAVTEHDWNHLLGLDYTRKILMLGFPTVAVRDALRDQVIQTGIPFSSEVECISAVRKKIESYIKNTDYTTELSMECIANYRAVYTVMSFIKMIRKKFISTTINDDDDYPDDSVYLYKQPIFNPDADSNNPMYRHEISFNLPYPNLTYHLESEYRITLDELNNYEITSRISSYLDRYQTAPLITIWKYLIDQDIDTRTTSTPINSIGVLPTSPSLEDILNNIYNDYDDGDNANNSNNQGFTRITIYLHMNNGMDSPNQDANTARRDSDIQNNERMNGGRDLPNQDTNTARRDPGIQNIEYIETTKNSTLEKCDNVSDNQLNERRLCKVCMTAEVEVVTFPCHHMVCCSDCLSTQAQCPVCRGMIDHIIKPILL